MLEGSTLGRLVELLVQAEILGGSNGRLIPSPMEPDVDHRDLMVAEVGAFGALWLQVKGTAGLDHEGRVVAFASYPADAIPENARLYYLVCLYLPAQHLLDRLWLIPSADFNRLAYREHASHPGRVNLQFSCRAAGDQRWDHYELKRLELGGRLEPLVAELGPAEPETLLALRGN